MQSRDTKTYSANFVHPGQCEAFQALRARRDLPVVLRRARSEVAGDATRVTTCTCTPHSASVICLNHAARGGWRARRTHTGAGILDGDGLELSIELLGQQAVGEVVDLGERNRRRCHPDRSELGDGHGNDCQRGRRRRVRKMHRYVCPARIQTRVK